MNQLTRLSLFAALCSPLCYFGTQALALPFASGHSILHDPASLLGSALSSRPLVFNLGAIFTGVVTVLGIFGLMHGLNNQGVSFVYAFFVASCALSIGLSSCIAGLFPLPSPRHSTGFLELGFLAAPFAFLVASWQLPRPTKIRIYGLVNIVALLALAAVYTGTTPLDPLRFAGLLQRMAALLTFVPLAVLALALLRRLDQR